MFYNSNFRFSKESLCIGELTLRFFNHATINGQWLEGAYKRNSNQELKNKVLFRAYKSDYYNRYYYIMIGKKSLLNNEKVFELMIDTIVSRFDKKMKEKYKATPVSSEALLDD